MHFWTVILENDKRKEEDEQQPVPDGVRVESTPRWENLVFPLIVNVFLSCFAAQEESLNKR